MIGTSEEIKKWLGEQNPQEIFEIKKYFSKRSLNSNSYCWALISKIADSLRTSKEEIYMQMLEDYGQSLIIPVLKGEKPNGFFKYYKFFQDGTINGKDVEWYKVFKGSSEYNTQEMTILVDGIVYEAKNLGIETLSPEELKSMIAMWQENNLKNGGRTHGQSIL